MISCNVEADTVGQRVKKRKRNGACSETPINNRSELDLMENLTGKDHSRVNRKKKKKRKQQNKNNGTNVQMEASSPKNGVTERDPMENLPSETQSVSPRCAVTNATEKCDEKGKDVLSLVEKENIQSETVNNSKIDQSTVENTMQWSKKKGKSGLKAHLDTTDAGNNSKEEASLNENNMPSGSGACTGIPTENRSGLDLAANLSDEDLPRSRKKKKKKKRSKDIETNGQKEDSLSKNGVTQGNLPLASKGDGKQKIVPEGATLIESSYSQEEEKGNNWKQEQVSTGISDLNVVESGFVKMENNPLQSVSPRSATNMTEKCDDKGKAVLSSVEEGNIKLDQMETSLRTDQSNVDDIMPRDKMESKSGHDSSLDINGVRNNSKEVGSSAENTTPLGSGEESAESPEDTGILLIPTGQSSSKTSIEVDSFKVSDDKSQEVVAAAAPVSTAEIFVREATSNSLDNHVDSMNEKLLDTNNDVKSDTPVGEKSVFLPRLPIEGAVVECANKKLLILDLNGILTDVVMDLPYGYKPDWRLSHKFVFKRPFCDDFLSFCFDKFNVGVWSSRTTKNVERLVDLLMGDSRKKLLFCWDQSHCTDTGFTTVENTEKPLVLKELKKLWENLDSSLPWKKGEYNETNTLLLDDSPYKALRNPVHTAIFPLPFKYKHTRDSSLGPGGNLRMYLERLAEAKNVKEFVAQNPFGQRAINELNPSWGFYKKIIHSNTQVAENVTSCSVTTGFEQ